MRNIQNLLDEIATVQSLIDQIIIGAKKDSQVTETAQKPQLNMAAIAELVQPSTPLIP